MQDRQLLLKIEPGRASLRRRPSHLGRKRRPGPGLHPEFPEVTVSGPAAPDFIRYLAAKQGLDDRSLNRHVWDHLVRAVRDRQDASPLRVLEVGCGIGTMLERLLDRGLLARAVYTGIDVEAEFIRAAAERFHGLCGGAPGLPHPGARRGHALLDPRPGSPGNL